MSGILTPGERPGGWEVAGDLTRRVRALEALENCCEEAVVCTPFPDKIAEVAAESGTGLLGYWRLGEPSGDFADTSGQAVPADETITTGSVALTRDVAGALPSPDDDGALQFNASDGVGSDYLTSGIVGGRFNLNNSDMSIIAWLKPVASGTAFIGGVIGQATFGADIQGWQLRVEWPLREVHFLRNEPGGTDVDLDGPTLAADEWTFVVATYSQTDGHKLYYDGVLVASDPTLNDSIGNSNVEPLIGRTGIGHASLINTFYGAVDEISVWSVELTSEQIVSLYASGLPCTPSGGVSAEDVTFAPAAGLEATNVQEAIEENALDLTDHIADPTAAHAASAVSFTPAGGISATDVQAAIEELDPVNATHVWMPLTTVVAGSPELVWDADDSLIPTLVPL